MNEILQHIVEGATLSEAQSETFIHSINEEKLSPEVITGVLIGIELRGPQLEEIKGFRKGLLELSIRPIIEHTDAIDLCGTGGDGKNTFNISTTTAFVLAAMGHKVIKHGNYGVSSLCGSSNVLEELGVELNRTEDQLQRDLENTNLCFLHAPNFHPVMKKVAPIRRNLGVRTIFNCLGPLVNPLQPAYQLTGTYSLELARVYQHILRGERKNFSVLYGLDGYDELTLTDNTRVLGGNTDKVLNADIMKTEALDPSVLESSSKQDAARIIRNVLEGTGTSAQHAVVAANVALARQIIHEQGEIQDLFHDSLSFIQSGEAIKTLKQFQ